MNTRLLETANFIAEESARGVRIVVKGKGAYPRSRVVSPRTFEAMRFMSDREFDGTAVLDLGIGVNARK